MTENDGKFIVGYGAKRAIALFAAVAIIAVLAVIAIPKSTRDTEKRQEQKEAKRAADLEDKAETPSKEISPLARDDITAKFEELGYVFSSRPPVNGRENQVGINGPDYIQIIGGEDSLASIDLMIFLDEALQDEQAIIVGALAAAIDADSAGWTENELYKIYDIEADKYEEIKAFGPNVYNAALKDRGGGSYFRLTIAPGNEGDVICGVAETNAEF